MTYDKIISVEAPYYSLTTSGVYTPSNTRSESLSTDVPTNFTLVVSCGNMVKPTNYYSSIAYFGNSNGCGIAVNNQNKISIWNSTVGIIPSSYTITGNEFEMILVLTKNGSNWVLYKDNVVILNYTGNLSGVPQKLFTINTVGTYIDGNQPNTNNKYAFNSITVNYVKLYDLDKDVKNSLVGFWNGVNISVSTINDRSYYQNNGTVSGSIATTQGKVGNSMVFNGSSAIILNNPTLLSNKFSINTRFKANVVDMISPIFCQRFVNTSSNDYSYIFIGIGGSGDWISNLNKGKKLVVGMFAGATGWCVSSYADIADGKYHNLQVSLDGSALTTLKVILDGNSLSYTFGNLTSYTVSPTNATAVSSIGAMFLKGQTEAIYPESYFSGEINYVQLFNYARTFRELKQGNQLKLLITGNNVIGNTVYSPMGNNGTINGSTVSVVADSTGNGFSFTNSGYISVPSSNDYSFVSPTKDLPFTISFDMTTPSWLSDTVELGSNMYIMCKTTSSVYEWIIATAKVNGIYFIYLAVVNSNATSIMYQGFSLPSTNIYTHNIFTYDGTASPTSMTFTSNGVNMSRLTHLNAGNYNGTSNRMSETGVPILIGSQPSPNNISDYRCKGVLNNIKIYKNQIGE